MQTSRGLVTGAVLALASLTACQSIPVAENAAKLEVSFVWPRNAPCFGPSPKFKLGNIPPGTKYLVFTMNDLNASYRHGGGTIAYTGATSIPEGALKSYEGPCPPAGAHTYEFSVKALNARQDLILGEGKARRKFPE